MRIKVRIYPSYEVDIYILIILKRIVSISNHYESFINLIRLNFLVEFFLMYRLKCKVDCDHKTKRNLCE